MKYLLIIFIFLGLKATSQQPFFHAHNRAIASGPVVNPYTPASGAKIILDAESVTTSGSSVTAWNDLSGNGYAATNATSGAQPTLSAYNGKPALLFDGGDYLTVSGVNLSQPFTIVVVERHENTISGYNMLYSGTTGAFYYSLAGATYFEGHAGGNYLIQTWGGSNPFELVVHTVVWDGTTSKVYVNNVLYATGNAGTNGMTDMNIGRWFNGTNFFNGYMHKIRVYERVLTEGEMTDTYNHENFKWNN